MKIDHSNLPAASGSPGVWKSGLALVAGFLFSSCERITERMEITEMREASQYAPLPQTVTSSAQRFGIEEPAASAPRENPLAWMVPEGWTDLGEDKSPGGMRLINLRFGPGGEGECYLSAIQGGAGGLEANINRWRQQMGLPPYSAEEIGLLAKKSFLGREAVYVVMDGDFKPVGATESLKGYRLAGLVQPAPEFTLFIKMTGPKELVEANESALDKFVQSIRVKR